MSTPSVPPGELHSPGHCTHYCGVHGVQGAWSLTRPHTPRNAVRSALQAVSVAGSVNRVACCIFDASSRSSACRPVVGARGARAQGGGAHGRRRARGPAQAAARRRYRAGALPWDVVRIRATASELYKAPSLRAWHRSWSSSSASAARLSTLACTVKVPLLSLP